MPSKDAHSLFKAFILPVDGTACDSSLTCPPPTCFLTEKAFKQHPFCFTAGATKIRNEMVKKGSKIK